MAEQQLLAGGQPDTGATGETAETPAARGIHARLLAYFANRDVKFHLAVVVGAALLISIAAAGAMVVVEKARWKPPAADVHLGGELVFHEMPPFVANLKAEGQEQRHIKLAVVVEVREAHADAIAAKEIAILDAVRRLLVETGREDLTGKLGPEWLRREILTIINRLAAPATAEHVLFKELLID